MDQKQIDEMKKEQEARLERVRRVRKAKTVSVTAVPRR